MPNWDQPTRRQGTSATKWQRYDASVLPFWIADMEFPTPDFVLDAIRERLAHPVLGYTDTPEQTVAAFTRWAERSFNWQIDPEWLVWLPGVVPGLNVAAQSIANPGDAMFVMPPVYYPFLDVPQQAHAERIDIPLTGDDWHMDLDRLARQAQEHASPRARALLLCNPQNPTGRSYRPQELAALGQVCMDHDLIICSDEIHCDLLLAPGAAHTPIASLSPDIANRTITLLAPTKTYNMPGLGCAVAVISNPVLRESFRAARRGLVASPSVLAYCAATAAWDHGNAWLLELRTYLRGNYAQLEAVAGSRLTPLEATYLGWIKVPELKHQDAGAYFQSHGLALSDGLDFGEPGYVRFNFACARPMLNAGLERLHEALAAL